MLEIEIGQAHRAYDDTLVTIQIFQKCSEKIRTLPSIHQQALAYLFARFDTPQSQWYRNYFSFPS